MSDEFDKIVNNQPEDDGELNHIWEALGHVWPHFYPGEYVVKSVILVECIDGDGDRAMRFVTSDNVSPWDLLGMIESARLDAQMLSTTSTISLPLEDDEDDG